MCAMCHTGCGKLSVYVYKVYIQTCFYMGVVI